MVTENNIDILITPKPKIINIVRTTTDNVASNVYLQTSDYANSNDYKVTIVRTINIPAIEDVNYVILDPLFDNQGRVVGGIKCNLVYISDAKTIDWEVIIQRVVDSGYTINPLNSVIGEGSIL